MGKTLKRLENWKLPSGDPLVPRPGRRKEITWRESGPLPRDALRWELALQMTVRGNSVTGQSRGSGDGLLSGARKEYGAFMEA